MKKYVKLTVFVFIVVASILGALILNKLNKPSAKVSHNLGLKQTQADLARVNKNRLIMQEFDKVWGELEKTHSLELKGLSQDKINFKLTPLAIAQVTEKLGVTRSEVRAALDEAQ